VNGLKLLSLEMASARPELTRLFHDQTAFAKSSAQGAQKEWQATESPGHVNQKGQEVMNGHILT
jgi:hypothetical protein